MKETEKIDEYKKVLVEKIENVGAGFLRVDKSYFKEGISPRAIETEAERLGINTRELFKDIVGEVEHIIRQSNKEEITEDE